MGRGGGGDQSSGDYQGCPFQTAVFRTSPWTLLIIIFLPHFVFPSHWWWKAQPWGSHILSDLLHWFPFVPISGGTSVIGISLEWLPPLFRITGTLFLLQKVITHKADVGGMSHHGNLESAAQARLLSPSTAATNNQNSLPLSSHPIHTCTATGCAPQALFAQPVGCSDDIPELWKSDGSHSRPKG